MRILFIQVALASIVTGPAWPQDSLPLRLADLRLEVGVSRSPIAVGDTATLSFRLRNLGSASISLTLGCAGYPMLAFTVRKSDGGWERPRRLLPPICVPAMWTLTIGGGADTTFRVAVAGRAAAPTWQHLTPGEYLVYAALLGYGVFSDTVAFTVRAETVPPN